MMRRRIFLLGLGSIAVLPAVARADAVDDLFRDVKKARDGLSTMVAPFTQERVIGLLASAVKSEGEVTIVRPDRLRWELKPPDAIVYFLTPEGFAYTTPNGGASAGKDAAGRFGAVLSDLMTLLGGDLGKLRDRYDITLASRDASGASLGLKPKTDDVKKHVKAIELGLGADLWSPKRVAIEEKNGDKSVIVFGKAQRDVKVDPSKMKPGK